MADNYELGNLEGKEVPQGGPEHPASKEYRVFGPPTNLEPERLRGSPAASPTPWSLVAPMM